MLVLSLVSDKLSDIHWSELVSYILRTKKIVFIIIIIIIIIMIMIKCQSDHIMHLIVFFFLFKKLVRITVTMAFSLSKILTIIIQHSRLIT